LRQRSQAAEIAIPLTVRASDVLVGRQIHVEALPVEPAVTVDALQIMLVLLGRFGA